MSAYANFKAIEEEIGRIARSCGRDPKDIKIIAVSKTVRTETVQEAIDAGMRLFGENKIQEAKAKIPVLKGDFSFHMIGHLQSNKARDAVRLFDLIHSIDNEGTALQVNREAEKTGKVQKVLIQVNASGEASKSGVEPDRAAALIKEVSGLKNLEIQGLMTMAPFTEDNEVIRKTFSATREIMKEINRALGLDIRELSMGMSSDYRTAVREGATMVRIGTAIFGERQYP
jgi:PLP dependent protein